MKSLSVFALVSLFLCSPAFAIKPCDELKSEIDKQLQDRGVRGYSLDIVAKDDVSDGKIVGSCEGGTKAIVYKRVKGN